MKTFIVKIDSFIELIDMNIVCVCIIWCRWGSCWSPVSAGWWPGLRTGESCWISGSTLGCSPSLKSAGRTAHKKTRHESASQQHYVYSLHIWIGLLWKYVRWCHGSHTEDRLYTPAGIQPAACPRAVQHHSVKNRWLSCDFRLSGCSTERCHEAPPTPSHTSCW